MCMLPLQYNSPNQLGVCIQPRSIRGRRTISSPQLSFVYTLSPSAASFGVIAWFNHHIWNAAVLTSATTLTLSLLNLYAGLGVHERSNHHIVLAPFAAYSIGTPLLADEVDASIIPKAANLQQFTGRLNSSQHIFRCRSRCDHRSTAANRDSSMAPAALIHVPCYIRAVYSINLPAAQTRRNFSSKSDDTSLLQGCAFNKLVSFQIELFFNSHGGPADPLTVPISSLEAIAPLHREPSLTPTELAVLTLASFKAKARTASSTAAKKSTRKKTDCPVDGSAVRHYTICLCGAGNYPITAIAPVSPPEFVPTSYLPAQGGFAPPLSQSYAPAGRVEVHGANASAAHTFNPMYGDGQSTLAGAPRLQIELF
ncbi:hypothetical protein R3P38DRAFT_3206489 [Favolaschia claudopus]|uniref:Uncharacterized protein n=1 Tax=Favolaschia claudopus TaxID=2862362 RepID=A0AAW0AMA7_9AGAR